MTAKIHPLFGDTEPLPVRARPLPLPPRLFVTEIEAPQVLSARFQMEADPGNPGGVRPVLILEGSNFTYANPYANASDLGSELDDLFVTFEIGGRDTVDANGDVLPVGGRDVRVEGERLESLQPDRWLVVPLPPTALLGNAFVTVTRPMPVPPTTRLTAAMPARR